MHGAQSNLCQKAVRCQLNQDCSRNLVIGAMLAPPCGSSSVARDRTAVMRTKSFPWGLPPHLLSDTDCEKVAVGNRCFRAAIDLIRTFNRFNLPCILENPHSSKCWSIPFLQSVVEHAALETFVVDCCQYGTQWRKRARLLCGNFDPLDLHRLRNELCQQSGKVCSASGKPHFHLSRCNDQGITWTRIAQPYPRELCRALAYALTAHKHYV